MYFTEQQKKVYRAPDGREFDPLRVLRVMRVSVGGIAALNGLLAAYDDYQDMLREGKHDGTPELAKADVAAARAEEGLVQAARAALAFDKATLDAVVLETLRHFLVYLEGKESPAASGPTSRPATEGPSVSCWPPMPQPATATKSSSGSG